MSSGVLNPRASRLIKSNVMHEYSVLTGTADIQRNAHASQPRARGAVCTACAHDRTPSPVHFLSAEGRLV